MQWRAFLQHFTELKFLIAKHASRRENKETL